MGGCSVAETHCTFCGLAAAQVRQLIAGPGVYICDGCVGKCNQILAGQAGSAPARLPDWAAMSTGDILGHLPRIAVVGAQVDASLDQIVAELRGRGVSWARLGAALGITRQSAWERFAACRQLPDREA